MPDPAIDATDSEYIEQARANGTISHSLSPAVSVQARYAYDLFDVSEDGQSDSFAHSAGVGGNYTFDERTAVGLNFNFRQRDSDAESNGIRFESETRTFDISFSLRRLRLH